VFVIALFVALMTLFTIIGFGSGAFDAYRKSHNYYVYQLDRQLMAHPARSEETDPDKMLRGYTTGAQSLRGAHQVARESNRRRELDRRQ
jgi:hypothetical protein